MQGCVCPHPPLLIPAVGGDNRRRIQATVEAMERLASEVDAADLVIVISPHTPGYSKAVAVRSPATLWGDFAAFRCPEVGVEIDNDVEFVDRLLERAAARSDLDVEPLDDDQLDHGVLVPLFFLTAPRLVNLSVARDYDLHKILGRLVRETADELRRDVLFVASGDLSHRLQPGAPAGYDPRGAEFDAQVVDLLASGDLDGLSRLDPDLVHRAGECGLRSFITLGAFLGGETAPARVLSYEGPFGVGYAVAAFGGTA
ncbi:MAG: class III extradiol dioxygenase subunit B-like domain-containing protein [Thermoleophilia bacterium]|jgi:AmmeMemoRadiSam system protein B